MFNRFNRRGNWMVSAQMSSTPSINDGTPAELIGIDRYTLGARGAKLDAHDQSSKGEYGDSLNKLKPVCVCVCLSGVIKSGKS